MLSQPMLPWADHAACMSPWVVSSPSGGARGRSCRTGTQWPGTPAPGPPARRSGSSGWTSGWSHRSSGTAADRHMVYYSRSSNEVSDDLTAHKAQLQTGTWYIIAEVAMRCRIVAVFLKKSNYSEIIYICWTFNFVYFVSRTIHKFRCQWIIYLLHSVIFCIIWNPPLQESTNNFIGFKPRNLVPMKLNDFTEIRILKFTSASFFNLQAFDCFLIGSYESDVEDN